MNFRINIKFVAFILIFISNFSCIKQSSNTSSTNSNNFYFLAHRGQDNPDRGVLLTTTVPLIEQFFTGYKLTQNIFKMNFKNFDKYKPYESSSLSIIKDDITKLSSIFDSESTFFWLYHAHGADNGTFDAEGDVTAQDIVDALKEGLNQNPNTKKFKRFVILAFSCYSDSFIFKFQEALSKLKDPLFEEGVYFASSDATKPTTINYSFEMLAPILFILRDQQFVGYGIRNYTYEESYKRINEKFLNNQFKIKNFNKYLARNIDESNIEIFQTYLGYKSDKPTDTIEKALTKLLNVEKKQDTPIDPKEENVKKLVNEALTNLIEGDNKNFDKKNPTFDDIDLIMEKLRSFEKESFSYLKKDSIYFDMRLSFTEGKNRTEYSSSPIFPPIVR